jgi:hypothetical protein
LARSNYLNAAATSPYTEKVSSHPPLYRKLRSQRADRGELKRVVFKPLIGYRGATGKTRYSCTTFVAFTGYPADGDINKYIFITYIKNRNIFTNTEIECGQTKGVEPKMRWRKSRSVVNWQGALKQKKA